MSQKNVEIVQQVYEAFAQRDFAAVLSLCSADFELDITAHPIPDFPNVGTGDAHLMRFFATYLDGFSEYMLEVNEIIDAGDKVMARCHDTARLGPGVVERDLAHVWTLDAGKIVRLEAFKATSEALEAAGLRE